MSNQLKRLFLIASILIVVITLILIHNSTDNFYQRYKFNSLTWLEIIQHKNLDPIQWIQNINLARLYNQLPSIERIENRKWILMFNDILTILNQFNLTLENFNPLNNVYGWLIIFFYIF